MKKGTENHFLYILGLHVLLLATCDTVITTKSVGNVKDISVDKCTM